MSPFEEQGVRFTVQMRDGGSCGHVHRSREAAVACLVRLSRKATAAGKPLTWHNIARFVNGRQVGR